MLEQMKKLYCFYDYSGSVSDTIRENYATFTKSLAQLSRWKMYFFEYDSDTVRPFQNDSRFHNCGARLSVVQSFIAQPNSNLDYALIFTDEVAGESTHWLEKNHLILEFNKKYPTLKNVCRAFDGKLSEVPLLTNDWRPSYLEE